MTRQHEATVRLTPAGRIRLCVSTDGESCRKARTDAVSQSRLARVVRECTKRGSVIGKLQSVMATVIA